MHVAQLARAKTLKKSTKTERPKLKLAYLPVKPADNIEINWSLLTFFGRTLKYFLLFFEKFKNLWVTPVEVVTWLKIYINTLSHKTEVFRFRKSDLWQLNVATLLNEYRSHLKLINKIWIMILRGRYKSTSYMFDICTHVHTGA